MCCIDVKLNLTYIGLPHVSGGIAKIYIIFSNCELDVSRYGNKLFVLPVLVCSFYIKGPRL